MQIVVVQPWGGRLLMVGSAVGIVRVWFLRSLSVLSIVLVIASGVGVLLGELGEACLLQKMGSVVVLPYGMMMEPTNVWLIDVGR